MAAIHLRQNKERPLTIEEVDSNFDLINREVADKLDTTSFTAVNMLTILDGEAGAGSTLDADKIQGKYPSAAAVISTAVLRDNLGNVYANQFYGTHVGAVLGGVTGDVTGNVTGNASNIDGILQIDHGGTGAVNSSTARNNLGMGTISTQHKDAVDITGGTIVGITDLAVADGGTGASTASGGRANLGLTIGSQVQAYNSVLSGISAGSGDGFVIRTSTGGSETRKFVAGNSIDITNVDGISGDIGIGLTLNPSVTSIIKTGTNGAGDVGQSANRFNVFYGKSTSAQYADLAEKYTTDDKYEAGTVIVVSLDDEYDATASFKSGQRVIGVVSTNPAHIMNDQCDGQAIALVGRAPVKVTGAIKKGQTLTASVDGLAISGDSNVFAQALESNADEGVKLVECYIK